MTKTRRFSIVCAALLACSAAAVQAQSDQVPSPEIGSLRSRVARAQERLALLLFPYPQVEAIAADYQDRNAPVLRIILNKRALPRPVRLDQLIASLTVADAALAKSFQFKIVHDPNDDGEPLKPLRAHVGGSTSNMSGCFEGTIGAAVVDPNDGRKGFLTCNHVAAAEAPLLCPNSQKSDEVVPGTAITKCHPGLSVGRLAKPPVPIGLLPNDSNEVDAAFVEADDVRYDDVRFCPTGDYYLLPQDIPADLKVAKYGAGSGYTDNGVIHAAGMDVTINVPFIPCGPTILFAHQILVDGASFAVSGDSGSLVIDENGKAVGMIFAGDESGKTYLNPINKVLDKLKVKLLKCPLR